MNRDDPLRRIFPNLFHFIFYIILYNDDNYPPMDARSAMYGEIIKEELLKNAATGGITFDGLRKKLSDVPEEVIFNCVEELKFGGMVEETDDGRLIMNSYF